MFTEKFLLSPIIHACKFLSFELIADESHSPKNPPQLSKSKKTKKPKKENRKSPPPIRMATGFGVREGRAPGQTVFAPAGDPRAAALSLSLFPAVSAPPASLDNRERTARSRPRAPPPQEVRYVKDRFFFSAKDHKEVGMPPELMDDRTLGARQQDMLYNFFSPQSMCIGVL
jgi:hypothetical protein